MSAKYYNTEHIHPYSWDQVAQALFLRYPNPFSSHVLSEDTVFRDVVGGVLYSRRFLTKTNKIPKWGERWLSGFARRVPLVEESTVDKETRTITTLTRNVGLSNFMSVAERVVYKVNPDDPSQTIALKEVWVESRFYGLRSAIKSFGVERFKKNCEKATVGFNYVIERVQAQQNTLREIGNVKLAEFQEKRDHLKSQAEHFKESAKSQAEHFRETAENIKESAKTQAEVIRDSAKSQAEHIKETTDNLKESAREKGDRIKEKSTALRKMASDMAKGHTTVHAAVEADDLIK